MNIFEVEHAYLILYGGKRVFNFFDEIKAKTAHCKDMLFDFNIVNISGNLLYVEGHKGLTILTNEIIAFKTKKGRVVVEGINMMLTELTNNSMLIEGKIVKTEIF